MPTAQIRMVAVLNLPRPVPQLLKSSAAIIAAMTGNTYFPTAGPLLTALNGAQQTLIAAETATKTRAHGTIANRDHARTALLVGLQSARALVQQVADGDPGHAEAIIASAGMVVRNSPTRTKPPFQAKQGATSGTVQLVVKVTLKRVSYEWQWSTDGGHNWMALPPTLQAKTTLSGVLVGTYPQFRYRTVTKTGQTDWSQPTSLFVN